MAKERSSIKAIEFTDPEARREKHFAGSVERQRNARLERLTHARALAITVGTEEAADIAAPVPAAPPSPQGDLADIIAAIDIQSAASSHATPPPAPRTGAGSFTWAERSVASHGNAERSVASHISSERSASPKSSPRGR